MEGNKQFNVLEKSDNHEIHCSYMTGPGMLGPHTSYYTHLTYVDKTTRPETRYHQGWDSRFPELGDHVWGGGANWPDNVAIALEQYRGSCIRPPGPIGGAPIKKRKSPKRKSPKRHSKLPYRTSLSAKDLYRKFGSKALKKVFYVKLSNGKYKTKTLRLNSIKRPYFANIKK